MRLLLSLSALALASGTTWVTQFGFPTKDTMVDMDVDADGDVFVGGRFETVTGNDYESTAGLYADNTVVYKLHKSSGDRAWESFLGESLDESLTSIAVTDRALFAAGDIQKNSQDMWLTRLDKDTGNLTWMKEYGSNDWDTLHALVTDDKGGLYGGGTTQGKWPDVGRPTSDGVRAAWLASFNSSTGNITWGTSFGALPVEESIDGYSYTQSAEAELKLLAASAGGFVYAGGESQGQLPGSTGWDGSSSDWLAAVNSTTGNRTWTLHLGKLQLEAVAVGKGTDLFAGGYVDHADSYEVWLAKYDGNSGGRQWYQQFGTDASDYLTALSVMSEGTIVAGAGKTSGSLCGLSAGGSDAWLAAFDASTGELKGSTQWGSKHGDPAVALAADGDGGVIVAGSTGGTLPDVESVGSQDLWVKANPATCSDAGERALATAWGKCKVCVSADWCPAGGLCAEGHTGGLCGECEEGWWWFKQNCRKCPENGDVVMVVAGILAIALCALLYLIVGSTEDGDTLVYLKVLAGHFQLTAVYYSFELGYPAIVLDVAAYIANLLSFNFFSLSSPECTIGSQQYEFRWVIASATPMVLLLPFGLLVQTKPWSPKTANRALAAASVLATIVFLWGVESSMKIWACSADEARGGLSYLDAAPEVQCDVTADGNRYLVLIIGSLLAFLFYFLALQFGLHRIAESSDTEVRDLVAQAYREGCEEWFLVTNTYKTLAVANNMFVGSAGIQAGLSIAATVALAAATCKAKPYKDDHTRVLELQCLTLQLLQLAVGLLGPVLGEVASAALHLVLITAGILLSANETAKKVYAKLYGKGEDDDEEEKEEGEDGDKKVKGGPEALELVAHKTDEPDTSI